jgi:hypothetical protein
LLGVGHPLFQDFHDAGWIIGLVGAGHDRVSLS